MGGAATNSRNRRRKAPTPRNSQLTNIVKTAVRIIAGSHTREVSRAAEVIGVSDPTLYRWLRAGSMREARGAEVLRVYELTGLPLEMLLRG
jgi:transposase-like protein